MLNAIFESNNGKTFNFGIQYKNAFNMDVGQGMNTAIGTSQSFSAVGETVESRTISGRTISVTGVLYGDVPSSKRIMRSILHPLASGKLTINGTHSANVYVLNAPSFSTARDDGRYTMQFFAPFPYFFESEEKAFSLGSWKAHFSFPVTYSSTEPHSFGIKSGLANVNVYNSGEVEVPYRLLVQANGNVSSINLLNITNGKFLRLDGELDTGDTLEVYRDENGILRAIKTVDGEKLDVLSWISEDSNFYELSIGDNLVSMGGESAISVFFYFAPAVWGVYE